MPGGASRSAQFEPYLLFGTYHRRESFIDHSHDANSAAARPAEQSQQPATLAVLAAIGLGLT